jgi:hypothetical protein
MIIRVGSFVIIFERAYRKETGWFLGAWGMLQKLNHDIMREMGCTCVVSETVHAAVWHV